MRLFGPLFLLCCASLAAETYASTPGAPRSQRPFTTAVSFSVIRGTRVSWQRVGWLCASCSCVDVASGCVGSAAGGMAGQHYAERNTNNSKTVH